MKIFEFIRDNILSGMEVSVNLLPTASEKLVLAETKTEKDKTFLTYSPDNEGFSRFVITVREQGNTVVFSIDASRSMILGSYAAFASADAVNMKLGPAVPDKITANAHDTMWWMLPFFTNSFSSLPRQTQSAFVKLGGKHIHMLPLTGDNFRCELDGDGLHITSDMLSLTSLSGDFLAVTVSDNPFSAVQECYCTARELGAVRVPLRTERKMPDFARGLGWCTWDSFRLDVTAELIYEKLREFKEKSIPLKWIIIDDGWLQTRDQKLCSFDPDPVKFPEGFGGCIKRIKEEFGVERVGVWHTFTGGYWFGIDPDSALFEEQKENLFLTPAGMYLPSLDEERAFQYWDAWHSRLKAWGVDFLKVDNQSSASPYLAGSIPTADGVRIYHRAMERSIEKNFGGAVINCMGMDMENVLGRPFSGISRNSDDFFPGKKRGLVKHLVQNVYNSLWHGQVYHCDFDMWWSSHESALQSGVLRAISGSPIYVSDRIGGSVPEHIMPAVADDGTVMLCDGPAMPTADCIYTDCREASAGRLQKIWNKSGENFAVAVFNLTEEKLTDYVDFSSVPGLGGGDYMAYEYFSKAFTRVNADADTKIPITLGGDGVAVYSVYPVKKDGNGEYILMGERTKYVPIAGKLTRTYL